MGHCNRTFLDHHLEITKSIYAKLPISISIYDNAGNFVYVNDKAVEIFGVKDIKNLFGVNIFNEPNTPRWVLDKIKRGEETEYELTLDFAEIAKIHPTNIHGIKRLLLKIIILRDDSGNVQGYLNMCEDITIKKQNEEALVEVHLKLARLMDFMISGIEIYDKNGILIDCNDYETQIFGLGNKADLLNENITLFNNPNLPLGFKEGLINKEDVRFEFVYDFDLVHENNYFKSSKNGKIYLEVKGAPIFSNSHEVIGYIVEANDITENKRQELQLRELHQNLELALSAGQVSAWSYDIDNKYFKSMFGNAIVGDGCTYDELEAIIHPDDRKMMHEVFKQLVKKRKRNGGVIVRIYDEKLGDYRFYESDMEIRTNIDGKIKDIIGTQRDVTEKCIKQLELDNSRKSLDLIMESSNFLAWDYDIHSNKYHILYGDRLIKSIKD